MATERALLLGFGSIAEVGMLRENLGVVLWHEMFAFGKACDVSSRMGVFLFEERSLDMRVVFDLI